MVTEDPGGPEGMHAMDVTWRGLLEVMLVAARCAVTLARFTSCMGHGWYRYAQCAGTGVCRRGCSKLHLAAAIRAWLWRCLPVAVVNALVLVAVRNGLPVQEGLSRHT